MLRKCSESILGLTRTRSVPSVQFGPLASAPGGRRTWRPLDPKASVAPSLGHDLTKHVMVSSIEEPEQVSLRHETFSSKFSVQAPSPSSQALNFGILAGPPHGQLPLDGFSRLGLGGKQMISDCMPKISGGGGLPISLISGSVNCHRYGRPEIDSSTRNHKIPKTHSRAIGQQTANQKASGKIRHDKNPPPLLGLTLRYVLNFPAAAVETAEHVAFHDGSLDCSSHKARLVITFQYTERRQCRHLSVLVEPPSTRRRKRRRDR